MYISKDELYTHLYDEVVTEINRDNDIIPYATLNDFPVTGDPSKRYKALDTVKFYKWLTNAYLETQYQDRAAEAIAAAISEAKGFLTQYDANAEFAKVGDARNPIIMLYLKDMAVWHFILIANPAVEIELREKRYNAAIKQFKAVQQGTWNPDLAILPADCSNSFENFFKYGSNKKRNDYYN